MPAVHPLGPGTAASVPSHRSLARPLVRGGAARPKPPPTCVRVCAAHAWRLAERRVVVLSADCVHAFPQCWLWLHIDAFAFGLHTKDTKWKGLPKVSIELFT